MATPNLTAEKLRQLLSYNPETGVFTWRVKRPSAGGYVSPGDVAGSPHGNGYISIGINGRNHYIHRLAWLYMTGENPNGHVDHKDGCRTNNAWHNLRVVTIKQNQENRKVRKDSGSGHKGINLLPSGRWRAKIKHNRAVIHIGVYDTIDLAIAARNQAERELFTHA